MQSAVFKLIAEGLQLELVQLIIVFFVLLVFKYLREKYKNRVIRRTETLQHLLSYLDKPVSEQDRLSKEMLFEDHFGVLLSWHEINYFRNRLNPLRELREYISCRHYFDLDRDALTIKGNKNLARSRVLNLFLYFVFGMTSVGMLITASDIFRQYGPDIYASWSIMILSLGAIAISFLLQALVLFDAISIAKSHELT